MLAKLATSSIWVPGEERVYCFEKGFIETENEEHFLLCCLYPDLKIHRRGNPIVAPEVVFFRKGPF